MGNDAEALQGGMYSSKNVALTPDGRVLVAFVEGPDYSPPIYSLEGNYLGRLGAVGDGPGEFRSPIVVRVLGPDSLFVADRSHGRYSILNAKGRWVRGGYVPPGLTDALPLAAGRVALNAEILTPGAVGFPLHLLAADGQVLRSFGAKVPSRNPDQLTALDRFLSPAGDSGFWAVHYAHDYVIEYYDLEGTLKAEFRRDADWFPSTKKLHIYSPTQPPSPIIAAIEQDVDGLVWVVVNVPDPRWARGLGKVRHSEGADWYPVERIQWFWDSVIEVLDPVTGRLLATTRRDEFFIAFMGGRYAAAATQDNSGAWSLSFFGRALRR